MRQVRRLFCLLATNDANEHFHEIIVKKKTYGESESNLCLRHHTVFLDPTIPGNVSFYSIFYLECFVLFGDRENVFVSLTH